MNIHQHKIGLIIICLLVSACEFLTNSSLPTSPTSSGQVQPSVHRSFVSGRVTGFVYDEENQIPLQQVVVIYDRYYSRPFEPYFDAFLINSIQPGSSETFTNRNGEFTFEYSYPSVIATPDFIHFDFVINCQKVGYKPFSKTFTRAINNKVKKDSVYGGNYTISIELEK